MPETAVRPRGLDDVIARLERKQITRSLLQADGSAWSDDPAEQQEISGWLGWLPVVAEMRVKVDDLESFARQVRQDRVETVVLLGMGGSSLAPIVLSAVFGSAEGSPHLLVIDTTDPEAIRHADEQVDPDSSLFIVSSKSGGTIEPNVLADYFWQRSAEQGDRFVAITDADTSLATL
ncbi:MAG TPA: transaldolase, partial [Dehalococcoidia bacterium]|nr:transaldolase [Dehalococcoidia bacterium]